MPFAEREDQPYFYAVNY